LKPQFKPIPSFFAIFDMRILMNSGPDSAMSFLLEFRPLPVTTTNTPSSLSGTKVNEIFGSLVKKKGFSSVAGSGILERVTEN
jgi:hypothetical protein